MLLVVLAHVVGVCVCVMSVQALICLVDKKTGEKSKTRPRFVKQDQVCIARLRTAGTICLETFKDFPQMGRFTLRDEGQYCECNSSVVWGNCVETGQELQGKCDVVVSEAADLLGFVLSTFTQTNAAKKKNIQ